MNEWLKVHIHHLLRRTTTPFWIILPQLEITMPLLKTLSLVYKFSLASNSSLYTVYSQGAMLNHILPGDYCFYSCPGSVLENTHGFPGDIERVKIQYFCLEWDNTLCILFGSAPTTNLKVTTTAVIHYPKSNRDIHNFNCSNTFHFAKGSF